ncbi:PD-(D/E)XK nuclease family protein [Ruthenibacterium lactatiformans]
MERAARPAHFFARETRPLGALLGDRLTLSPTRVEQYYRCRFSYFLQYVLRIRPRRRAELSPLESGSLVHYILEHVMRRAGAEFPRLAPEELARLAGEVADQYVAENMPAAGRRFAYLVERLKRGVTRLLAYLQAEQAQSLFHPAAFEQEIGTGEGAVPPLTLRTPDGRTVQVQGKIDRVDVMEREGRTYLRVVDYKTGNKAFNLDEVYCGLNTQMLLYLFTLRSNAAQVYKNPVAAGVLYLAGDPVLKTGSRAEAAAAPVYKVDGLVLNDELVVRGMDRDATGMFVPFAFGKDGAPRASAKLASLEKLGNIEKHLDALVVEMARGLYAGEIDAVPLRTAAHCPCDVCDYRPVCLHEDGRGETSVQAPKDVFETRADACKAQGEGNI